MIAARSAMLCEILAIGRIYRACYAMHCGSGWRNMCTLTACYGNSLWPNILKIADWTWRRTRSCSSRVHLNRPPGFRSSNEQDIRQIQADYSALSEFKCKSPSLKGIPNHPCEYVTNNKWSARENPPLCANENKLSIHGLNRRECAPHF